MFKKIHHNLYPSRPKLILTHHPNPTQVIQIATSNWNHRFETGLQFSLLKPVNQTETGHNMVKKPISIRARFNPNRFWVLNQFVHIYMKTYRLFFVNIMSSSGFNTFVRFYAWLLNDMLLIDFRYDNASYSSSCWNPQRYK